jgi:serine/threonine protein phosphatase PrpC
MPTARPTVVVSFVKTDVGMVREHNEDSSLIDPDGNFFIVADGMGGHAAGEVASAMAVAEMTEAMQAARPRLLAFAENPNEEARKGVIELVEVAVKATHQAVFERGSREADKKGMGTTLEVLVIADAEAFLAHVGDSRTYLLRGGKMYQVTTDHTVAEILLLEGKLTPEEARFSPLRTVLVNAIGVSADVLVDLAHIELRQGDKLLLCSDGMHDYFPSERELGELLLEQGGQEGLDRLVKMAKDRGGHDNITGVLVEVTDGLPLEAPAEEEADKSVPTELPDEPTLKSEK